ncbi:hypothetical protein HPB50_001868 [Hyalomma asiaticum]|uniref:Uncharacterized protein n=1 Tax=Hyalomma asiaticum TaxID=266040 RepID=A0ACB7SRW8_HYAAI|nr:hypothetical protein HPB50_001868 [Hyalomma asiaticum]
MDTFKCHGGLVADGMSLFKHLLVDTAGKSRPRPVYPKGPSTSAVKSWTRSQLFSVDTLRRLQLYKPQLEWRYGDTSATQNFFSFDKRTSLIHVMADSGDYNKPPVKHRDNQETVPRRNERSAVWKHFARTSSSTAPTGATSPLVNHVKQHPAAMKEFQTSAAGAPEKGQSTMSDFVHRVEPLSRKKTEALNSKVAAMAALDLQPYSVVEDHGFKEHMAEAVPNYRLPSQTTLSYVALTSETVETYHTDTACQTDRVLMFDEMSVRKSLHVRESDMKVLGICGDMREQQVSFEHRCDPSKRFFGIIRHMAGDGGQPTVQQFLFTYIECSLSEILSSRLSEQDKEASLAMFLDPQFKHTKGYVVEVDQAARQDIALHGTKCTALIAKVIAPYFAETLARDLSTKSFSILVDETTDISVKKLVCISVRYYSDIVKKVVSTFLDMKEISDGRAESIYETVKAVFCEDSVSPRWLAIADCIDRIVSQYGALRLHFATVSDRNYNVRLLKDMYEDERNLAYLTFLAPILADLKRVNRLVQGQDVDPLGMLEELERLFKSLLTRIIKPSVLRQHEGSLGDFDFMNLESLFFSFGRC